MQSSSDTRLVQQLTADIIAAFVTRHQVTSEQLTALISEVHSALVRAPAAAALPEQKPLVPAVSIKKSVTADYIICLEDGEKFKSLKRHLNTDHSLSPDEYRAKWSLPRDYPMVAPSYSTARSALAKSMGLGRKGGSSAPAKKTFKARKRAAAK